jgi:dolichyl-phosphate beta-glucosyltransferase
MTSVNESLSIIIPAYNEAVRLPGTLERIITWIDACGIRAEIIVSDDGSTDETVAVVGRWRDKDPRIMVLSSERNRGKGAAVRRGVEAATSEWILFSDADLSTPIEEFELLAEKVEAGYDIAIGSRDVGGSRIEEHQPWYREAMGRTFNRIVQVVAIAGIKDTQCGFKLFSAAAAKRSFSHMTIEGFAFDVEVLFIARRLGYRIAEVGIRWINDDRSTVHPVRDAISMFVDVVRIRFRQRGLER